MATLFFNSDKDYKVGAITFDLLLSEEHNFNSTVSQYNVENGSSITDHVQNDIITGTMSALITTFSLYDGEIITNKCQDVLDKLEELYLKKELVDVVTLLKVYKNVIVTGINIPKDNSLGEAFIVTINFQQVNIVKLSEFQIIAKIKLLDMKSAINKQNANQIDYGKTQTRPMSVENRLQIFVP